MNQQCVSGWRGAVQISNNRVGYDQDFFTTLPVVRWTAQFLTELAEVTAGTERIRQWVEGYTDVEINLDCLWMGSFPVFGTLTPQLNLTTGQIVKLILYIDQAEPNQLSAFVFPQVLISRIFMEEGVRDVAKYTLTGKQSSSVGPLNTFGLPNNNLTYPSR